MTHLPSFYTKYNQTGVNLTGVNFKNVNLTIVHIKGLYVKCFNVKGVNLTEVVSIERILQMILRHIFRLKLMSMIYVNENVFFFIKCQCEVFIVNVMFLLSM